MYTWQWLLLTDTIMMVREMQPEDWQMIKTIYEKGIATGNATFQTEAPPWEDWDQSHLTFGRLVAETGTAISGWAALSGVSSRCVYSGVAEVSIYVDPDFCNQGIGKFLLKHLIFESERRSIWMLQAGIFRENLPSINLHKQAGFREVGFREKIGKMNGIWRDTLLFERRSQNIL
jgi:L-amino acid N-acyltransferase YncA